MRPLFRWFGSKARLARTIHALIPPGRRIWVELFAGSAIVTLSKGRHAQEHLNDLDGDVVNLFDVLRDADSAARLAALVDLTPYAELEFHAAQGPRDAQGWAIDCDQVERARRFLVRCWMGMGGVSKHRTGFRFSVAQNTDPSRQWPQVPATIAAVNQRLKGVTIWSRPAADLLGYFADKDEAVVFADPPYPTHSIGKARYRVDMTDAEHEALAHLLASCRCAVILTMNPGTVYSDVLRDWRQLTVRVRGTQNEEKPEIILTNFDPPAQSGALELSA